MQVGSGVVIVGTRSCIGGNVLARWRAPLGDQRVLRRVGASVRWPRCNVGMDDDELLDEVRRLRGIGASPKDIARALGLRPAAVAPLVREVAAERPVTAVADAPIAGCWVSPGWSNELVVERRDGWDDVDVGSDGPAGIAIVLVARARRHDRVTACVYLVDTFCLGVKNVTGPLQLRDRDLPALVRMHFAVFQWPALRAPIELAQHLVLGAVAFAARLGCAPHPDFDGARGHLGELREPCAITFGREGRPLYVAGPHDDPIAIMQTLVATLGSDGFAVAA